MAGSPTRKEHTIKSQFLQDGSLYCSHDCLVRNKHPGRSTTRPCPNQSAHDNQSLETSPLAQLLMDQLSSAGPGNAGLTPLAMSGRSGVLYRVYIHQTGHRLVAKGYQDEDLKWLQNEVSIYARLQDLQGLHLPVYCGAAHLQQPLMEAGGRKVQHLLLFPWAGEALNSKTSNYTATQATEADIRPQLMTALRKIHELQVVHGDTERRNFLFDQSAQRFMLVDFERSRMYSARPACSPDEPCRKAYLDNKGRRKRCMYCREMWVAGEALSYESPGPSPTSSASARACAVIQDQAYNGGLLPRGCMQSPKARRRHRTSQARDTTGEVAKNHSMKLRTRA